MIVFFFFLLTDRCVKDQSSRFTLNVIKRRESSNLPSFPGKKYRSNEQKTFLDPLSFVRSRHHSFKDLKSQVSPSKPARSIAEVGKYGIRELKESSERCSADPGLGFTRSGDLGLGNQKSVRWIVPRKAAGDYLLKGLSYLLSGVNKQC